MDNAKKKSEDNYSLSYKLAGWYGMAFSVCFLIYGGVKIVLGILDHNYEALGNPIVFTIVGLILISFVLAYKEFKKWGWYGLVVINGLVILLAVIAYKNFIDIILLAISAIALYFLFAKETRQYFLKL